MHEASIALLACGVVLYPKWGGVGQEKLQGHSYKQVKNRARGVFVNRELFSETCSRAISGEILFLRIE